MEEVDVASKLQRYMKAQLVNLTTMITSGGVDNMEEYKYMQGQANAYQAVIQEISNLLTKGAKEDDKGNVIDLGKGSSKDKPRS